MFITFQARSGRSYLISIVKRSGVNFFTDENSAFDLDAEIIDGSLESNLELEMLENGNTISSK